MNLFQQQHLSATILVGCSTLSLMTACHFHRHYNLLLDRLKTETHISNNLNTLIGQQDLTSVNLRIERDQIDKQVKLLKKMIDDKRIRIDEMKSLVQDCDQIQHDKRQSTALGNKLEEYLSAKNGEKNINRLSQRKINNKAQSSISVNQIKVSQMIDFFEQKS